MASPLNCPPVTTRAASKMLTEITQQDIQNNPLFNHVVLREIFGYLENSSLMKCRLVNKFWNDVSCRVLRKAGGYILFKNDYRNFGVLPYVSNPFGQHKRTHFDIQDMPNFIKCVNSASNFPFTKFKINTNITFAKNGHFFTTFVKFISPWTTELIIGFSRNTRLNDPSNGITFPSLKSLTFYDDWSNTGDTTLPLVVNILTNAPSLEKLKINYRDEHGVTQILNTLAKATLKNFSHFVIDSPLNAENYTQLSSLKCKLKKLHLILYKMDIPTSVFKNLLESQSASLEELKLTVTEARGDVEKHNLKIEFPRMRNLKKLTLDMLGVDFEAPMSASFPSISYVNQFPVLRSLNFSDRMHEKNCVDFFKSTITPSKTITELEFAQRCDGSSDILLSSARLFPNLKKLSVPTAYKKVVDVACQYWPMLEELVLQLASGDGAAEDIITGLAMTRYQKILDLPGDRFSKIAEKIRQKSKRKAISCLKNLQILRIKPEYIYGCSSLDAPLLGAAYKHEILKLPSLKCVDFRGKCAPCDEDAKQVLAELRKKFVVLL